MSDLGSLLATVAGDVVRTFQVNWIYLVLSITLASAIQVFVGTDRLASWLQARTPLAVAGAVALGALTPFCSCGTTAVVLGALAASVPWAPIVAFMVSSPLTSPGEYVLSVGLFGSAFATTFFVAAIALGLGSGWAAHHLERTGWLRGQHRIAAPAACSGSGDAATDSSCQSDTAAARRRPALVGTDNTSERLRTATLVLEDGDQAGCCDASTPEPVLPTPGKARQFLLVLMQNAKRLAAFFFGFTAIGYLLIRLVPTEALTTLLGDDSAFAVPMAALLGIPVYLNSDGSLPLVASLMEGGMGSGAAMAFLITGAGTSIGAISGMLLIARRRVVALVVGSLFVGAVVTGYLTPLLAS